ncbi:MAG: 4Fe-4S dicluster domain-containing protein, partial [Gammaproteobacteria bacterium]|nr:4Fe-4S dicluster domain-containing protein [Gammaproteobacteria bacterium]
MTGKLVSNRLSLETDSQVRQAPDPGFDFSACNGCGLCLTVCPGWRRHHDLRLTAQGFSLAMQHDLAPAWHDLQNCTLCGACDPICPQTTAPVEMIMELRRRHPREQDHADIRNRFGVEMEAVSASNHNSGAIAVPRLVLLPDRELAGRPQLVAGIQSLLGDEATVAGDAGG